MRGPTVKSHFILGTQILRLVARVTYSTVSTGLYFLRSVRQLLTLHHLGRLKARKTAFLWVSVATCNYFFVLCDF